MFQTMELTFRRGTVLTSEMLGELYGAPRETLEIVYDEYPDGILTGAGVMERGGDVYLRRGLVKYGGRIYRMAEELNLSACVERQMGSDAQQEAHGSIFLCPAEPEAVDGRGGQVRRALRVTAVPQDGEVEGLPFAAFRYARRPDGIKLSISEDADRDDPSSAKFWNMAQCPYAIRGGVTYHPYIFALLRERLLARMENQPWYCCVLEQLATTGVLSMELIAFLLRAHHAAIPAETLPEPERRRAVLKALVSLPEISVARPRPAPPSKEVKRPRSGGHLL